MQDGDIIEFFVQRITEGANMEKIGLLGAMPQEIELLCRRLNDRSRRECGGITFYEGTLDGRPVALCCAGMGKAQAAAAVQLLVTVFGATAIVFSGIAGNMSTRWASGTWSSAERWSITTVSPGCLRRAIRIWKNFTRTRAWCGRLSACAEAGVKCLVGRIATGDCFVGDSATKNAIAAKCAPDCVEMEGGGVAHIAAKTTCRSSFCAP